MGRRNREGAGRRLTHERWTKSLWHGALRPLAPRLEEAVLLEVGLRVDLLADLRETPAPALSERFGAPLARLLRGKVLLLEHYSRPVDGADIDRAAFATLQARRRFGGAKVAALLLGWGKRHGLWNRLAPWPREDGGFGRWLRSAAGSPIVVVDVSAVPMDAEWALVALSARLDALGELLADYLRQEASMGEAVRKAVQEATGELERRPGESLLDAMRRIVRRLDEAERRQKEAERRQKEAEEQGERRALLKLARELLGQEAAERLAAEPDTAALRHELTERLKGRR